MLTIIPTTITINAIIVVTIPIFCTDFKYSCSFISNFSPYSIPSQYPNVYSSVNLDAFNKHFFLQLLMLYLPFLFLFSLTDFYVTIKSSIFEAYGVIISP